MSIDSIIYLSVAGVIFWSTLATFGFLFHGDKDDPGLFGASLVSGLAAVFWPIILAAGILTTPYWAGKALKGHRDRVTERKALAREETVNSLIYLLGQLDEASVARTVLEEQLAELGKNA